MASFVFFFSPYFDNYVNSYLCVSHASAHNAPSMPSHATWNIPTDATPLLNARRDDKFSVSARWRYYIAAAAVATMTLAVVAKDSLTSANITRLMTAGDTWYYSNPETWLPNWGASMSDPPDGEGKGQFTLHTYCKSAEVKKNYADFWLDGEKEAYLVRHNYGSPKFFLPQDAIKMERVILDETTGERGYVVNTAEVDYEFGFALRNIQTGEWLYEIGKGSEAMLYNEPCVQQFGSYFNRIRTSQPDPSDVEWVLGSCEEKCAADYLETANQLRFNAGVIPPAPGELIVGKSDDARLFTLHSAVLGTWIRSAASRDTKFGESENEARHIVAHVDAYGPNLRWSAGTAYLLMAQIKVVRKANHDIALSVVATKFHNFGSECTTSGCSAAVYDLTEMWYSSDSTAWAESDGSPGRRLAAPLFTLGEKGDTRVNFHEFQFPDDAYLDEITLFEPNTWGKDLDARRISPVSGAIAGRSWWGGKSIRNYHPMIDETSPSNANERTWIWAVLGGGGCGRTSSQRNAVCVTMTKMKIFVAPDGSVKARNMGSKRDIGQPAEYVMSNIGNLDVIRLKMPIGALFNQAPISVTTASQASTGDVGISGLKLVLAPEMTPSLAGMNVFGLEPNSAESSAQGSLGEQTPGAELGQSSSSDPTSQLTYDYPHYFNHEYPGTSGCETTCEGDSVTASQCASMFYCEWYQEKCWSKVGSADCPVTDAELDERTDDAILDSDNEDISFCTVECEYETESECAADPICTWTGGACFSQFSEPCPM